MMKKLQHPQIIIPTLEVIPVDEKEVRKYLGKIKLKRITIIFFGSDSFVIPILQALEDNFEVPAVVTATDSAVANYFKGSIFTSLPLAEQVSNFKPDLFVVASYGRIISKSILNIARFGALNVHPSLLPKYRGPAPVPATILAGDQITGVTIIKMDEEMDHGPIVATKEISLTGRENFLFLINKLFQLGADLLVETIPDYITGKIKLVPQNHSKATFTKVLKREDGYFDISNPPSPEILDRMIRAYYPWPGVWTRWNNKIVKFLPFKSHPESLSRHPERLAKDPLRMQDASNELRDSSSKTPQNDKFLIQMEGKKVMPLQDFLNGYPDFPLKNFPFFSN